jgi:hypothetical protein
MLLRQLASHRLPVWIASWVLIPFAFWSVLKDKVDDVVMNKVAPTEVSTMIEVARSASRVGEIVLIQPGRDGNYPEAALSRKLSRPTLVNWNFVPTLPSNIATWYERQQFRLDLFENGCEKSGHFPIGALIVRNQEMPQQRVVDTCGPIIWRGSNYSVIDVK